MVPQSPEHSRDTRSVRQQSLELRLSAKLFKFAHSPDFAVFARGCIVESFNFHARLIPPLIASLPRNPASLSRRPHAGRLAQVPDTSSAPPPSPAVPSFSLGHLLCCRRSTTIL